MVSKRGNTPYDTSYRFIDLEGVPSSATITVEYLIKGGKKYYNNSGKGIWICDFDANATLYAHWK